MSFTKDEKRDIAAIGHNLATHILDNNIPNVMLVDGGARLAWIPLTKSLNSLAPNHSTNIYFTNPSGYNTLSREPIEISAEFDTTYSDLSEQKSKPLLLFDACIHSGSTVNTILNILEPAGYSNVLVGVAQPQIPGSAVPVRTPDFVALPHKPAGECTPFGSIGNIQKGSSVTVNRLSSQDRNSYTVRKNLLSMFDKKK